jgi:hypothetical protein
VSKYSDDTEVPSFASKVVCAKFTQTPEFWWFAS